MQMQMFYLPNRSHSGLFERCPVIACLRDEAAAIVQTERSAKLACALPRRRKMRTSERAVRHTDYLRFAEPARAYRTTDEQRAYRAVKIGASADEALQEIEAVDYVRPFVAAPASSSRQASASLPRPGACNHYRFSSRQHPSKLNRGMEDCLQPLQADTLASAVFSFK